MQGVRFLITQPMIHGINGSTMVAMELSEYLISRGASVVVYTYYRSEPAELLFQEKGIKVTNEDPNFMLEDFDYIWVHSQVLPISIIRALSKKLPTNMPAFIFNHMSPFDWIPDERPYIYNLERKLSALSLFVSSETQKEQAGYFEANSPMALYRNPAPVAFSRMDYTPRDDLKRILIVSNHPPEELIQAKEILMRQGYAVVAFGEVSEEYGLITPEVIVGYDVIITIGKTVQYALTAGVPVYIYDRFGGNGYLDKNNYETAMNRNFSGRDGERQSADFIAKNIVRGYKKAIKYHTKNKSRFIKEFSIDNVLPDILKNVKRRKIIGFNTRYLLSVESAQRFGQIRFQEGARNINGWNAVRVLESTVKRRKKIIESLEQYNEKLMSQLGEKDMRLKRIYSFRVYARVKGLLGAIKHAFKKKDEL